MSRPLERIWRDIEAGLGAGRAGWVRRLANQGSKVEVYAAVACQGGMRSIMLDIPLSALARLQELPITSGLSVQLVPPLEGVSPQLRSVVVELDDPQFSDIFSVFCEDLLLGVSRCDKTSDALTLLLRRVERWQEFLAHAMGGLSKSEVVGLYGELTLLHEVLLPVGGLAMLEAWTGAERAPQDFIIPGACGIEVKTSTTRVLSHVLINGERQLDDTGLSSLFLVCQRVEASDEHGENLNDVVGAMRSKMTDKPEFLSLFESRLAQAGYFDPHHSRYDSLRLRLAQRRIFRVNRRFPRVLISTLPSGVDEIAYRLDLKACVENECDQQDLMAALKGLNLGDSSS